MQNNMNPMQMMQNLKQFASGIQGNPQEIAMKKIQEAGLNQQQLNQLQQQANSIYAMAQQFGIFK